MWLFGIQPKFFSIHALNQAFIKTKHSRPFHGFVENAPVISPEITYTTCRFTIKIISQKNRPMAAIGSCYAFTATITNILALSMRNGSPPKILTGAQDRRSPRHLSAISQIY